MFGNPLVQLIFNMAHKAYSIGENGKDDTDMTAVTTLFIALIENYKGKIDHFIEPILQLALQNIQKKRSKPFKAMNYCVVLMLLWYNSSITLALLNKHGLTDQFLQAVFD